MSRLEKEIVVMSYQGLHARPAAMFVQIASKYEAKILVQKDQEIINGKSIMGLLMLGAQKGSKIKLVVEGQDAQEALLELEEFLSRDDSHEWWNSY